MCSLTVGLACRVVSLPNTLEERSFRLLQSERKALHLVMYLSRHNLLNRRRQSLLLRVNLVWSRIKLSGNLQLNLSLLYI